MSQPITVIYNFKEFRTKVKPSTLLVDVLDKSCSHFNVSESTHTIVYNGKELDTSLPFRFLNLPHGVKVHLKSTISSMGGNQIPKAAASSVNIRLQILAPDKDIHFKLSGSIPVRSFSSSETLYDVIKQYEQITQCNLLERKSYYDLPNAAKRVHCSYIPTIQNMSKVVSGIDEFKTTKLRSMGLVSGNHSLRLCFKRVDVSSEEISGVELNGVHGGKNVAEEGDTVAENAQIESEGTNTVGKRKNCKNSNESAALGNFSRKDADVGIKMESRGMKESEEMKGSEEVKGSEEMKDSKEKKESEDSNNTLKENSDTSIKVYKHQNSDDRKEDTYSDSEYNMTIDQAKAYRSMLLKMGSNGPMMTRRQREALKKQREPVVTSCKIRIRFPDQTLVQLELPATKTLGDLYKILVSEVLELSEADQEAVNQTSETDSDGIFFELLTMHPKVVLLESRKDFKKELVSHCGLGSRSVLVYREKTQKKKNVYVRKEYMQKAMPLSAMDDMKADQEADKGKKDEKRSPNEIAKMLRPHSNRKVPKWFKMGRI